MSKFKKISEVIGVDDSGSNTIICVNGQWQFTLPEGLTYETDSEFTLISGGIDLSGSIKPLVLKGNGSYDSQGFCAAVEEHYSFTGDYMTAIDCKYDNRFVSNSDTHVQKILVDESDFYVDLIFVNLWPFGLEAMIRIRGDEITPYNIAMVVKYEERSNWESIADYFGAIARTIQRAQKTSQRKKTAASRPAPAVTNPSYVMSGTTLQRYIGYDTDIVLVNGITELADNIFSGRSELRSIVIPESVTRIGRRAFENCHGLQRVTLPEGLRSLGGYAFVDCHNLESINLSEDLECIEDSVFSECFKLKNVELPAGIQYIDAFAFKSCRQFTKIVIPDGVTSIGFLAFAYCDNLEYLYIPASVTQIRDTIMEESPFVGSPKLKIRCPAGSYAAQYAASHNIPWQAENKAPVSKKHSSKKTGLTFASKKMLQVGKDLQLPIPDGYKACEEGTGVNAGWAYIIPQNVSLDANHIDAKPYSFGVVITSALKLQFDSAKIEACKQMLLGEGALASGVTVDSVVLSNNGAFLYQNWTDTADPTYNKINGWLWYGEEMRQFHIYANHKSGIAYEQKTIQDFLAVGRAWMEQTQIGKQTSDKKATTKDKDSTTAKKPEKIYLHGCEIKNGSLHKYSGFDEYVTIPDCVNHISYRAFAENPYIKHVVIGQSVQGHVSYCFDECKNLETIELPEGITTITSLASRCENLRTVKLPKSLLHLANNAFYRCKQLRNLQLHEGLRVLDLDAFDGCIALGEVQIPYSVERINLKSNFGQYTTDINKIIKLKVYTGSPAEKELQKFAQNEIFRKNFRVEHLQENIQQTTESNNVITEESFEIEGKVLKKYQGCASIVTIPEGVTEIGEQAFSGNLFVRKIILPEKTTKINDSAFSGCQFLEEIHLPDTIRALGQWVFADCTGLKKIELPPKIKVLKKWTFNRCSALEEVTLPAKLTKLSFGCFEECYSLKSIAFPETLSTIEGAVFNDTGLISITIPPLVKKLEDFTFSGCLDLKDVYLSAELEIDENIPADKVFFNSDLVCLHVAWRSAAEDWAKRSKKKYVVEYTLEQLEMLRKEEEARKLAEEKTRKEAAEVERKRLEELAAKRTRYDEISKRISEQERIIAENRGWFGAQAKARKAAQQQLSELQAQLAREFPNGRL